MNTICKHIAALFLLLVFGSGSALHDIISLKQISEMATEMPAQETEDSLKENETVREAHHSFEISLAGFPQPDRALLSPTVANKILSSFDPVFSPPPNQQA